jgi:hypothetical protein
VNSPEDGPVGPKHVEIRRYMNKIEIVTSVGFFISYVEKMHYTKSLKFVNAKQAYIIYEYKNIRRRLLFLHQTSVLGTPTMIEL